ncbi:vanadium-dependent haloperoxidase [Micromonospora chersina]|uniref:PAP2 superfamily protein n=1 Tax=Micromonospora chersina TaxID=47854 RepID=A0A1C6U355_9ACTN|nr:vanadium-dependent haloperoxidase [Micromonospora chersina]SCL48472.1 PAP2 superfamily protein [Micromonospora chersina]
MASRIRTVRRATCAAVVGVLATGLPLAVTPSAAQASAGAVSAESVLTWDLHAETAIWDVARQAPQVQSRGAAMVHGAIYDAVNAIAGTPYQPYLTAPAADGSESVDAAVAAAAYRVLDAIFPDQHDALTARYAESLAAIPDGRAERRGIEVGTRAATAMIAARRDDGAFGPQTFPVGTEPGQWRPTPPAYANDGGWVGHMRPFVLPSASIFRTSGPPALTSAQYARDYDEIKAVGSANSTVRTADQTEAAIWWHDRRLGEWEIKRQLVTTQRLTALQAARMFAMVDVAEADAVIACFNEKEAWNRWRPITAIRLGDTDRNPATAADPDWTPLLVTPPHPDYTSGHTCNTGATMSALAYFFGRDDIPFDAYSADSGTRRYFSSFSQALTEVINARVWGGIHTRTADVQGARIGLATTAYLVRHQFRPRS